MKDDLGDRMKAQYENRTRIMLPRRTYTILRLDGKAFHTYTRNLKKPFDANFYEDMDAAIVATISQIQGSVFAYTQSDEISILLTDFDQPTTSAWFDGNLQKMCSVAASIITAEFNRQRYLRCGNGHSAFEPTANMETIQDMRVAYFDARVFTIPDRIEVMNYFIWRNQDCARNSVSMVAQTNFSHKELQGKSTIQKHEMLQQKGVNWAADFTDGEKNGRFIVKEELVVALGGEIDYSGEFPKFTRSRWVAKNAWKLTENKDILLEMIPKYT